MKVQYVKPYISSIGTPVDGWFHYDRDDADPVIPYFVLDTGAFLLMRDLFDTDHSSELADLAVSGKFFEKWQYNGTFDWDAVFQYPTVDNTRIVEWHVFLHRLYILMPLAAKYYHTKDQVYADKFYAVLKNWFETHPYVQYDKDSAYYNVWRDMQVAWRTISLCLSCYFLDGAFDEEQWKFIYRVLELHAEHLLKESVVLKERGSIHNHALQEGTALVYLGCLFGEFPHAKEYLEHGKEIVSMNLKKSIGSDGVSLEDCPSYAHFIARMFFDVYMLLENNGKEPIEGLKESVEKQYECLYQLSTSHGQTTQFNDSYVFSADRDLEIVQSVSDIKVSDMRRTTVFSDSHLAVLRAGDLEVFVDALGHPKGITLAGHQHYGRPNIIAYYRGKPIIVDSGACNYDRRNLRMQIRACSAHNAMFAKSADKYVWTDVEESYRFDAFEDGDVKKLTVSGTASCDDVTYSVKRTIEVSENKILLRDEASCDTEQEFVINMHLSNARLIDGQNEVTQLMNENMLKIKCPDHTTAVMPCMNTDNAIDVTNVLCVSGKGTSFATEFEFTIV